MIRALVLAALVATPAAGQVVTAPVVAGSAVDQVARDAAAAAQSAASASVKTVNGTVPNASGAVTVAIPTPALTMPPGVADSGSIGTMSTMYALANHTHASKARKNRVLVPVVGTATFADVTFSTPFTTGVSPLCAVTAVTTAGDANVVNAQIDGLPTATGMRIRITRTAITVASLLGLNILSVPTQIATNADYICLEP